jgi:hypothetical protein
MGLNHEDVLRLHRAIVDRIKRLNPGRRVWELDGKGHRIIGVELSPMRHATLHLGGDKVRVHIYERPKPPQIAGRGWTHWVDLKGPDFVGRLQETLRKENTAF